MLRFLITPQVAINHIWRGATLVGVLMMSATVVFADALDTPTGIWQTIDDYTNQPKALVQITQGIDGTLSGKVVKGLVLNDSPERRCTECSDERKDQKILGMTIIRNMKLDSDGWDGGNILDPNSGILVSLDFELVDVDLGKAVFAGQPGEHAYNPLGTVHGGYAATLLDSACGCAVHSRLTEKQAYTTLELKISYHKTITKNTGLLRAEGTSCPWGGERHLPMRV